MYNMTDYDWLGSASFASTFRNNIRPIDLYVLSHAPSNCSLPSFHRLYEECLTIQRFRFGAALLQSTTIVNTISFIPFWGILITMNFLWYYIDITCPLCSIIFEQKAVSLRLPMDCSKKWADMWIILWWKFKIKHANRRDYILKLKSLQYVVLFLVLPTHHWENMWSLKAIYRLL